MDTQFFCGVDHRFAITHGQRLDQSEHITAIHTTQHLLHGGLGQLPCTKRNRLVGK